MRTFITAAICFVLLPFVASANNIGTVTVSNLGCHSATLTVGLGSGWQLAPPPHAANYSVWADTNWEQLVASSNANPFNVTGLHENTHYDLYVTARSRHNNGGLSGWGILLGRQVDDVDFTTPYCNPGSPVAPPSPPLGAVRLRHEATGQCIYGNTVEGGEVHSWSCWRDPAMAVILEPVGGNDIRIRMWLAAKCLFGNPVDGQAVKDFTCWSDPNEVFTREDLGNNRARFRHKNTGKCMYAAANGVAVKNFTCWSDPNMVWVVDPF